MRGLYPLKKYFLKYKKAILSGFICIIVSNGLSVYIPLLLKESVDSLQKGADENVILRYSLAIIGVSLVAGVFRYLIRQTIIASSREIETDMRYEFWEHIQKLPLRFFQNTSTGNIMAHATNDISAARMFVGPAVMYSLDTSVRLVAVLVIMFSISVELSFYALLPLPVLSILVYKIGNKIHKKYSAIQEHFSILTAKAQESFSGIRTIKSFVREENEISGFEKLSAEYLTKNMAMIKLQALFHPFLFLISGSSLLIVVLFGGSRVIDGVLTLGDISAFMVYLILLIWPMIAFGWVVNISQQASASMKRLTKLLTEPQEILDSEADFSITEMKGDIEFKDVSFKYGDRSPCIIKEINIRIPRGKTGAIVGATGSGKTTLINLIPRLYDPVKGEVIIDGHNVKRIPLKILRKNIGFVSQESYLFSDTIGKNISYGLESFNGQIIQFVSNIAQLEKDAADFPNKYETIIGEKGVTLSGGQKQRTALARALAIDPKILILDDSFSSVDVNTEETILANLKEFAKDKTCVIISHRISTVQNADIIFVLKNGEIAESGNNEELIKVNGVYAQMRERQTLEKELEELN